MPDKESTSGLDRRLLYGAAGFGAVLLGVLMLKMTSGGGDDVAVGVVPRATAPAASTTTTVAISASTVDVAAALASPPPDPFNQIVTAPAASQSVQAAQPGQVTQATQAKPASQGTSTSTTKATTTTTTTAAPASATQAASAALTPAMQTAVPTVMSVMTAPVAIAGLPLSICIDNGTRACTVTTPAVTSVSLLTSATLDPAAPRAPTIALGGCSNGQGVASVISSGSNGTVVTGMFIVTMNGGQSTFPVTVAAPAPDQTVLISACVPPGVGVPIPQPGTQSTLGGVLGTVTNSVVGLLGVLSADSGLLAGRT